MEEKGKMKVNFISSSTYASNCYLVVSDDGTEALLIDPSVSYDFVFRQCGKIPPINKILLTHAHFDHVLCLDEWREKTGAKVYATQPESEALTDARKNANLVFFGLNKTYNSADETVSDGDVIHFGNNQLKVLLTPGHTLGSCCYYDGNIAFTGDTLFADGGVGRTDLYGGSEKSLVNSLTQIFSLFAPETIIYSGHGRQSTVREELRNHKTVI